MILYKGILYRQAKGLMPETIYYHGGSVRHKEGEFIRAEKKRTEFSDRRSKDGVSYEDFMEAHRPSGKVSRLQCIYLVKDRADLNRAGATEEHVYEVKVVGYVTKVHWGWFSALLGERKLKNNPKAVEIAKKYWSGAPNTRRSQFPFEYLASSVQFIKEVP